MSKHVAVLEVTDIVNIYFAFVGQIYQNSKEKLCPQKQHRRISNFLNVGCCIWANKYKT